MQVDRASGDESKAQIEKVTTIKKYKELIFCDCKTINDLTCHGGSQQTLSSFEDQILFDHLFEILYFFNKSINLF